MVLLVNTVTNLLYMVTIYIVVERVRAHFLVKCFLLVLCFVGLTLASMMVRVALEGVLV